MKTTVKIIGNASSRRSESICFLLFMLVITINAELIGQPHYQVPGQLHLTQVARPDLVANQHIISDTVARVPIQVIKDGRVEEVSMSLSAFRLSESGSMAIVQSRTEVRSFESE